MALSKDGEVHHIRHNSAAKSSAVYKLPVPQTDTEGFYQAADELGQNLICLLTDVGLEVFDSHKRTSWQIPYARINAQVTGRMACVAGSTADHSIVVGTSEGQAWMICLAEDVPPEQIHDGTSAVTSVCLSATGAFVAVGDDAGQVYVYNRANKEEIFVVQQTETPTSVRFGDSQVFLLYHDRLEGISLSAPSSKLVVRLVDGVTGRDFDFHGPLAVILGHCASNIIGRFMECIQVIDLTSQRVVSTLEIPAGEMAEERIKTELGLASLASRLRLWVRSDGVSVIIGSKDGLIVSPLLAVGDGRSLIHPDRLNKRERPRLIKVVRMGQDEITCDIFEVTQDGKSVVCGYSDNYSPTHSGEILSWEQGLSTCSNGPTFDSPLSSIALSEHGNIVIGTKDGDATSWRLGETWHPLAAVKHPVEVVTVACCKRRNVACSVSRDGLLLVWDTLYGNVIFRTCAYVMPVAVGFADDGHKVCMVDASGEMHIWEIVGASYTLPDIPNEMRQSADEDGKQWSLSMMRQYLDCASTVDAIRASLGRADFAAARQRSAELTNIPNADEVVKSWQQKIDQSQSHDRDLEPVRIALTKAKALTEKAKFADARAIIRSLPEKEGVYQSVRRRMIEVAPSLAARIPDRPSGMQSVKRMSLEQIDNAEKQYQLLKEASKTLDRAKALAAAGKFDEAREQTRLLPDQIEQLPALKTDFLKKIDEAQRKYEALKHAQAVQCKAENHIKCGVDHFRAERYHEALLELNEAGRIDPSIDLIYFIRSQCYLAMQRTDEAEHDLRKFKKLTVGSPEDQERAAVLGKAIENCKTDVHAMREYGGPEARTLRNQAAESFNASCFDQAIVLLKKAIAVAPTSSRLKEELAIALTARAIDKIKSISDCSDMNALIGLEAMLTEAVKLDPKNETAKSALVQISGILKPHKKPPATQRKWWKLW